MLSTKGCFYIWTLLHCSHSSVDHAGDRAAYLLTPGAPEINRMDSECFTDVSPLLSTVYSSTRVSALSPELELSSHANTKQTTFLKLSQAVNPLGKADNVLSQKSNSLHARCRFRPLRVRRRHPFKRMHQPSKSISKLPLHSLLECLA